MPIPSSIAGIIDNRCLQDEELQWRQYHERERQQHLPPGRFAYRHEAVKSSQQRRIDSGEDGERATAVQELKRCREDSLNSWFEHKFISPAGANTDPVMTGRNACPTLCPGK